MTNPASFAIGVPTYNQAPYLRATLLSLLDQDEAPDRILVCNNHSTDETAAILAEFEGRIDVIMPPHHLTMMENWNYLVSQLSEDWFALLSSDDLAYPAFTRVLKRGIPKSPNAVLVRAGWDNIDQDGVLIEHHRILSVGSVVHPPQTLLENRLGPKGSFAAFAVKRDTWVKAGRFPEELLYIGDWGLWINLAAYGDFIYENEIISGYRVNTLPAARRKRDPLLWGEHALVYRELLPAAAKLCGVSNVGWIAKSCRRRFLDVLAYVSRNTAPDDRADYVLQLRPWAELAGEADRLSRFEDGEEVRYFNAFDMARNLVRPLVQRFRS